jgi:hypothetical protein
MDTNISDKTLNELTVQKISLSDPYEGVVTFKSIRSAAFVMLRKNLKY